jgi:hypothetical protein
MAEPWALFKPPQCFKLNSIDCSGALQGKSPQIRKSLLCRSLHACTHHQAYVRGRPLCLWPLVCSTQVSAVGMENAKRSHAEVSYEEQKCDHESGGEEKKVALHPLKWRSFELTGDVSREGDQLWLKQTVSDMTCSVDLYIYACVHVCICEPYIQTPRELAPSCTRQATRGRTSTSRSSPLLSRTQTRAPATTTSACLGTSC